MPATGGPESDSAGESVLLFAEVKPLEEGVGVDETVGVEESIELVGLDSLGVVRSEGLLVDEGAIGFTKRPVSSLSASSSVVSSVVLDTDMPLGRDEGASSSGDETVGAVLADGSLEGCDGTGASSGCGKLTGRSLTRISSSSSASPASSSLLLGRPGPRFPALA